MGCRGKVELSIWQVGFLIALSLICVVAAVIGWFHAIGPLMYDRSSYKHSNKLNNVTLILDTHQRFSSFLDDIGSPPKLNNPHSYIQWTVLQMNDVYELIPLSGGKKGGLARVATIRKLLLQENPNTITILAGDVVSPSALGNSIVNGSMLNGKQMIATLNVLGLDYATLGNHEFDLNETSLRRRLNESRFEWIASNVHELNSTKPFHNVLPYKIITILNVKILIIGLTIDENMGPLSSKPYVAITSQQALPDFTAHFIKRLRLNFNLKWDVLICLTHLNMHNDIEIVEHNPDIDVLMGGHEHENYYLKRGSKYTPICKADDNAFSVFIHRFAYQPKTKKLLIFSKLTPVSPRFLEEPETAKIANYFYEAGLQAYRDDGYFPEREICILSVGLNFDGRSTVIRSQQTHLTNALCNAMMNAANTTICVFNAGAIRLDDQLMGTITQYDILRCLPFPTNIISLRVTGSVLVKALNRGLMNIHTGMFISYTGVQYDVRQEKWFLQSNHQPLDDESLVLTIASIPYFMQNTELKHSSQMLAKHLTMTRAFIKYLEKIYTKTPNGFPQQ
ncbi:unnamed protein product [Rotaria socialis]|uniref:5'-nucleotidase n=1 Tax=Rotaria socialis TaxID=392032 RepID=A0A818H0P1_9BILA|nr:unnamed protein product [Rotaria socialis]CAF4385168.1 unnamed protein product [Rotaria socialis]